MNNKIKFTESKFKNENLDISLIEKSYRDEMSRELDERQEKMNDITKSLTPQQIKDLKDIIYWCELEKVFVKRNPPA